MFIKDMALKLRNDWGLDETSPIDIFSLVGEWLPNLTLLWFPMNDNISGCCSKEDNSVFIFINSNHTKGRQNFTLAHELYHLFYDDLENFIVCPKFSDDENEKKANDFASQFLLPDNALKKYKKEHEISNWNIHNVIDCEQYYRISHKALLYRLKKDNLITNDEFKELEHNVKYNAKKLGYDIDLYEKNPDDKKFYAIGEIIRLNEEAYKSNKISKGLYNEILNYINRVDIIYNDSEGEDID